jgi:hypothetical protein
MANKKVSELNAASALNGSEVTHGVQSGGDVKISATQILTYVGANLTKNNVGLANVDNTSDESKPLSLATQTELDKKQNIIQFIDIDALNNAILSSPVWIEGQLISVASEPPGVKRIWNGIDALTATIQNGSIIYLNNTSNTISNTTGIPNNAVGIDGDVRIDVTNNLYYQKANGLWSSGIALFPGGELYHTERQQLFLHSQSIYCKPY